MKKKLEGIIPPIITPFREDGTIDLKLAEKEMKISLDAGVDGLSVGGSTGEGPTLRDEELAELIKTAKKAYRRRAAGGVRHYENLYPGCGTGRAGSEKGGRGCSYGDADSIQCAGTE